MPLSLHPSRRWFVNAAVVVCGAMLATASPRVASAEGTDVQAYGARIELATGALAERPGIKTRALQPTGPILVGSSRFDVLERRLPDPKGGGTITVEERDSASGALRRTWQAAKHPRFYDKAVVELHAEPGAILVDVHFLTYL